MTTLHRPNWRATRKLATQLGRTEKTRKAMSQPANLTRPGRRRPMSGCAVCGWKCCRPLAEATAAALAVRSAPH